MSSASPARSRASRAVDAPRARRTAVTSRRRIARTDAAPRRTEAPADPRVASTSAESELLVSRSSTNVAARSPMLVAAVLAWLRRTGGHGCTASRRASSTTASASWTLGVPAGSKVNRTSGGAAHTAPSTVRSSAATAAARTRFASGSVEMEGARALSTSSSGDGYGAAGS
uniref:Uncharacterized protein n=1 Tax=uncultured Nocardioidaceae bacterium TaxID=253824 RepID=A0A6J4LJE5_9ACTN|nr:MAG: hypothetical protein AVDCRST_MAG46-1650 [uncultured Nocardioidaceae bacterium]